MVHQVLQRFGFQYSSPQLTPLSTSHSLSAPPSDESVEPSVSYPELVGCLITSGMGLVLGGRGPVVLTGHADASWVDDSATQRSSQGYTFNLGSGLVSWRSNRSSSVLSSSCEAEIYAGAMAAQELRWLTYLLTDLGEQPRSPPVLYVDNKAMIALCQEHRLEHKTKHIALRYFLARELQQRGQLRLAYVATRANTADVFTKALPPDGQTQRVNQTFERILRCITMHDTAAWDKLSMAKFAYNNTHHSSTGMSPFFALYGQHPNVPTYVSLTPIVPRADNFHQHLTFIHDPVRKLLELANARMARTTNRNRREVSFLVGDRVLLDSRNLRLPQDSKLRPRFIGPFDVERALGPVAYCLRLPAHFRMHPSFHVSLLRPYTDPNTTFSGCDRTPLPVAVDTGEPDYQIQRILRHRRHLHGGVSFIDFLARWRGYDAADDSWVPSSSLSPDNACLKAYLQSAGTADVASLGGG
ncbi:unnamed protein product [Closterium sp. NIES-54]